MADNSNSPLPDHLIVPPGEETSGHKHQHLLDIITGAALAFEVFELLHKWWLARRLQIHSLTTPPNALARIPFGHINIPKSRLNLVGNKKEAAFISLGFGMLIFVLARWVWNHAKLRRTQRRQAAAAAAAATTHATNDPHAAPASDNGHGGEGNGHANDAHGDDDHGHGHGSSGGILKFAGAVALGVVIVWVTLSMLQKFDPNAMRVSPQFAQNAQQAAPVVQQTPSTDTPVEGPPTSPVAAQIPDDVRNCTADSPCSGGVAPERNVYDQETRTTLSIPTDTNPGKAYTIVPVTENLNDIKAECQLADGSWVEFAPNQPITCKGATKVRIQSVKMGEDGNYVAVPFRYYYVEN